MVLSVIISPHADDEIIGCWEILKTRPLIIYTEPIDDIRYEETKRLAQIFPLYGQIHDNSIIKNRDYHYYFPHPIYETHPTHRRLGMTGETMLREGYDVTFYITEMTAPFKFECKQSKEKLRALNTIYPSQKSLWKYEHKFFLFSGYDKWLIF